MPIGNAKRVTSGTLGFFKGFFVGSVATVFIITLLAVIAFFSVTELVVAIGGYETILFMALLLGAIVGLLFGVIGIFSALAKSDQED